MDDKTQTLLADYITAFADARSHVKQWEKVRDDCRKSILDIFRQNGLRRFATDEYEAATSTMVRNTISVVEAKAMLLPDVYDKLCKETVSVILKVSQLGVPPDNA